MLDLRVLICYENEKGAILCFTCAVKRLMVGGGYVKQVIDTSRYREVCEDCSSTIYSVEI